jgi:hypothetical protein
MQINWWMEFLEAVTEKTTHYQNNST